MHGILLYLCAGAVVAVGSALLSAFVNAEPGPPWVILRRAWAPPVPLAALAVVAVLTIMAVVQIVHPAVIDDLQRDPHGGWWRSVTALLVQTSGGFQLIFNLAALAVVVPIAERAVGGAVTLVIFLLAGVISQVASTLGWSPHGGGDSVATCGLVGALSVLYALRGYRLALRRLSLVIPVAALVLLLLTNNHGVGLAVGCLLGLPLARWAPEIAQPTRPVGDEPQPESGPRARSLSDG